MFLPRSCKKISGLVNWALRKFTTPVFVQTSTKHFATSTKKNFFSKKNFSHFQWRNLSEMKVTQNCFFYFYCTKKILKFLQKNLKFCEKKNFFRKLQIFCKNFKIFLFKKQKYFLCNSHFQLNSSRKQWKKNIEKKQIVFVEVAKFFVEVGEKKIGVVNFLGAVNWFEFEMGDLKLTSTVIYFVSEILKTHSYFYWNVFYLQKNEINKHIFHFFSYIIEYRVTQNNGQKIYECVFDLSVKIQIVLEDSTYVIERINGHPPIVGGHDELHFDHDLLKIWERTLQKYKCFILNGIDFSTLSYATAVTEKTIIYQSN